MSEAGALIIEVLVGSLVFTPNLFGCQFVYYTVYINQLWVIE